MFAKHEDPEAENIMMPEASSLCKPEKPQISRRAEETLEDTLEVFLGFEYLKALYSESNQKYSHTTRSSQINSHP